MKLKAAPGASVAFDVDVSDAGPELELATRSPWAGITLAHTVWVDPILWWATDDDAARRRAPTDARARDRLRSARFRF